MMLRGLYRFYLYLVFVGMVLLAIYGSQPLLQIGLAKTILPDTYGTPGNTAIIQATVFTVVAWFIALLLGGLHYWLIRRDMRNDLSAGSGGIRAFFLNFVEAYTIPTAVIAGIIVISSLGRQYSSGLSGTAAAAITGFVIWAILELERRRTQAGPGAAIIFQRLHFYGIQLLFLITMSIVWLWIVGQLVDSIIFHGSGTNTIACGGFTVCEGPNLLSYALTLLWVLAFWLGYGFFSRNDTPSLLRKIVHVISFGYGVVFVLIGVYHAIDLAMLKLFKVTIAQSNISGPFALYDIVSPLTLGLLIVGVYIFFLRRAAQQQKEQISTTLTMQAVATAILSVSFWWGCGLLLLNGIEHFFPSNTAVTSESWAMTIALIVTGLAYIPLNIHLRLRSEREHIAPPLRGLAFVLLSVGILTGAIGGAISLYAYGTAALGSPLDNWQYAAHAGLATLIVAVVIVGIYLWESIHEGFFAVHTPTSVTPGEPSVKPVLPALPALPALPTPPIAPVSANSHPDVATLPTQHLEPATPALHAAEVALPTIPVSVKETRALHIGNVLDKLQAGSISRNEAITQIESITED